MGDRRIDAGGLAASIVGHIRRKGTRPSLATMNSQWSVKDRIPQSVVARRVVQVPSEDAR